MMFRLQISPPEGERFEYLLEGAPVVIGRSSHCELTIADRFLSRQHARIFDRQGRWVIEDLGSHNGTLVNGREISTATPLAAGDEIQLSATRIEVRGGDADSAAITPDLGLPEHTLLVPAVDLLERQRALPSHDRSSLDALQRYGDRFHLLNEVHDALAHFVDLPGLLDLILARTFEHLQPEEGVVLLKRRDGGCELAAHRTIDASGEPYRISETLVREVVVNGHAALVLDVAADERFAAAESMIEAGVRSLIAAPLQDEDGALGMIALSSHRHRRRFGEEDLELLTSLASVAALRIRNLALAAEAAEHRRLEDELRLARQIQISLLPDRLPQPSGYVLCGMTVPSRGVSGDFYEAVERGGGTECVLVIADVSGKGIGAALLTASLEALLVGPIDEGQSPEEICRRVNHRLFLRTPAAKFATVFLAVLEVASGRLRYTSAGHNPALVVRASNDVERLDTTGIPLGLLPGGAFQAEDCVLGVGDTLVIYTDGITEAVNEHEEEYGVDRLGAVCTARCDSPLEELVRDIERDLDDFVAGVPYADDRTVLAVRREEEPGSGMGE